MPKIKSKVVRVRNPVTGEWNDMPAVVSVESLRAADRAKVSEDAAKESALEAEAWSDGQRDGADVTSGDPAYQNNAKYWKDRAKDEKEGAEAWSRGTKNGTDVGSSDPAYHDNAKYWKGLAEDEKEDAEAWAKGTKNGEAVSSGADQYHNNAKYWNDEAKGEKEDAEAYAVGKRDGVDVTSGDEAYHNNAKYYADAASDSATAAAASAASIASSAAQISANASGISALNDTVYTTRTIDLSATSYTAGLVKDDGTWTTSSNYHSYWVPVSPASGEIYLKVTTQSDQSTLITFLKSNSVSNGSAVPLCTGETGRRGQAAGTTITYAIPSDCAYVCVWKDDRGTSHAPTSMDVQTSKIGVLDGRTTAIEGEIDSVLLKDVLATASIVNGVASSDGKTWSISSTADYYQSFQFANDGYFSLSVTANPSYATTVAFTTGTVASLANGDDVPYCQGTTRIAIAAGATKTMIVPSDCAYIVIFKKEGAAGVNRHTPSGGILFKKSSAIMSAVDAIPFCRSKSAVTACIIGASIEAGRTHDRITGNANANDPEKAYLTVALRNNGVAVTNKAQGGMGWKRVANDNTSTCKGIVDAVVAGEGFSSYDSLYFCLGANDWSYNVPLGAVTDAAGADTVCGQMKYAIETVFADNPGIKIFVKDMGDGETPNSAGTPYTKSDLMRAMTAICDGYGVEIVRLGWIACTGNISVTTDYYPRGIFPDGVHPCPEVMALMAKETTGRITYK